MDVRNLHRFAITFFAGAAILVSQGAAAQAADTPADPSGEEVDEVVVTGFRASLQSAANAKRDSVNFTDSVFAEDIGKFPDLNIAESLNRVPGILLTREVNGEGLNISIRGLGTSFTKTVVNGAQISVASSGGADAQNTNREMDLDLFPTELFSRLDVSKTPTASLLEGGVSGVVNMRSARPFDNPGTHFTYQLQGNYGEISEEFSPRAALIGSWTNDTFGVLVGVSAVDNKFRTKGFETIGWTNATLSDAQCGAAAYDDDANPSTGAQNLCNDLPIRGNGFNIPAVVPMGVGNASNGLVDGETINAARLAQLNPGVTLEELGEAIVPRLGRPADFSGSRERQAGIISLEWRPTDSMRFYADAMYAKANRKFDRTDMNWVVRGSNRMFPVGVEVDDNGVVSSGTFANAQFFLEARPYEEDVDFWNFNPGAHFEFGDRWQMDFSLNKSRSWFLRESPTVLVTTPDGIGVTAFYENSGDFPRITTNVDLNNPNLGWSWVGGRLNLSLEKRLTHTEGAHWDVRFGDDQTNVKVGAAYDRADRGISGRNNDARWEDVACRGGLDANGNSPATGRVACTGTNPAALIPQSSLASYLRAGEDFITIDFDRFKDDSMYRQLRDSAPEGLSAATGANNGDVDEKTIGGYLELNHAMDVFGRNLRMNAGARYVKTDQVISAPNDINGQRIQVTLPSDYDEVLPSANFAYNVTDDIVARVSASKTLTRVNPNAVRPATNFNDPSALTATQGNPFLQPFTSKNIDIGGEWYTGDEGYVSLTAFQKKINFFTVTDIDTVLLPELGIPGTSLSQQQRDSIMNAGGTFATWQVNVQRQVNFPGTLKLQGYEVIWSQPLTFMLPGLGFTANYTRITLDASEAPDASAAYNARTGVAPHTANGTVYYENHGATVRLSYTWNDQQVIGGLNQQNIPQAGLFSDARGVLDMSASYQLANFPTAPTLTLNVQNVLSEAQRATFWQDSAAFTYYEPGFSVVLGLRGTF
jgi:TonB-dependent receptor